MNKAWLQLKQYDKALDEIRVMARISGGENRRTAAESAQVLALAGRRQEALEWLRRIDSAEWRDPKPLYLTAVAHANLGELEIAFQQLNAALDARTAAAIWMASDPELDSIRSDPRYRQLLERLRLTGKASRASH
jgi:tetratricopeptide (TPR) repeat protein